MSRSLMVRFIADERGATAVEYALIVVLLAMALIGALTALGSALSTSFGDASDELAAL